MKAKVYVAFAVVCALLSLGCLGAPSPEEGEAGEGYGDYGDGPSRWDNNGANNGANNGGFGGGNNGDDVGEWGGNGPARLVGDGIAGGVGASMYVDADHVIVVDGITGELVRFDRHSGRESLRIALGGAPEQLVVLRDTAWVTLYEAGQVARLDLATGRVEATVDVGAGPWGIARDLRTGRIYATVAMSGHVVALDPDTLEIRSTATGLDTPRAVAVTGAGVVVTVRGRSAQSLTTDTDGDFVDAAERPLRNLDDDPVGASPGATPTLGLAVAVHPVTKAAIVVHQVSSAGSEESVENRGGTFYYSTVLSSAPFVASVTQIGHTPRTPSQGAEHADPGRMVVPRAVTHHPTHNVVAVAGYASDSIELLDSEREDPMQTSFGILGTGRGPKALGFSPDGDTLYAFNELDGTVGVHSVGAVIRGSLVDVPYEILPVARRPETSEHRGRSLFSSNRVSSFVGYNWSCTNCHYDGLSDGLTWIGPNGVRQAPALSGRLEGAGPYNWKGTEPTLVANVNRTMSRLGGIAPPEDMEAIADYLLTMSAPPSPPASAASERGREVFEFAGCARCHSGSMLTDGLLHDMGVMTQAEQTLETFLMETGQREPGYQANLIKTPSLIGLRHSAPYLHDGSAGTLSEVLDGAMPPERLLLPYQRADLLAYLASL